MIGVTETLKKCGLIDTAFLTEEGARRGSAVHKATELDDQGALDPESIHPRVAGPLESWRRFRAESGIEVVEMELEVVHVPMGYIGHLDRVIRWPGRSYLEVVDLKCGATAFWHTIQTALYAMAYAQQAGGPTPRRSSVYLKDDGKAAVHKPHTNRRDFDVAKAVVTLGHFMEKH